MKSHTLKTWPTQFQGVVDRKKLHEWRRNDRDFAAGDELVLVEWDPSVQKETGRRVLCIVTWLTVGFGVPEGWCCMSIRPDWRTLVSPVGLVPR